MSIQGRVASESCTDPHHCITCSDEGVPMRVTSVDDTCGIAVCVGERGSASEVMIALVSAVRIGDVLLVHAGTALTRLAPA